MTVTSRRSPGLGTPKAADANGRNGGNSGAAPSQKDRARGDRRGVVGAIADRRLADLRPVLDDLDASELKGQIASAGTPRPFALTLAAPGLHLIAEI